MNGVRTRAAAGAAAFLLVGLLSGADRLALARLAVLGLALGAIVATDLAERRIPNRVVAPAGTACLTLSLADGVPLAVFAPAVAIAAVLLVLALARPDALGMGDAKLALLLAAGLGGAGAAGLILGLVLAALAGLTLVARHGTQASQHALPLAPFLATGALIAVLL